MRLDLVQEAGWRSEYLVRHSLLLVEAFEEACLFADPAFGAYGIRYELGPHALEDWGLLMARLYLHINFIL